MNARRWASLPGPGLASGFVLALAACAVGPDFHPPAPPQAARYTAPPASPDKAASDTGDAEHGPGLQAGTDIPAQWWGLFHSPALDTLVRQALAANADVRSAQAALRQADALRKAQRAQFLPSVTAEFLPSRQRNASGTVSSPVNSPNPIFNLYTSQVVVGYSLDLFGGNQRQYETAVAQVQAQQEFLAATRLTLAANVVANAIQEASLREQIEALRRTLALQEDQVRLLRRAHELGAAAQTDVLAQEALLAQTAAQLPPLEKQLAQLHDALAVLLGELPAVAPAHVFTLQDLRLPDALPLSLPSRLVEQRPDVRLAQAQLHAACAQVGVALAARLPQISLQAASGGTSEGFRSMFASGNRFWSAGINLSQTIFDAGAGYYREKAAVAALDQAGEAYRSTVLMAFQNVADSLHAIDQDGRAFVAGQQAEAAAQRSLDAARKAQALGATGAAPVILAEQTLLQARAARIQAQAARLGDAAALLQALGGGWWNETAGDADGAVGSAAGSGQNAATRQDSR
jgi:NodT family efflux transporter outer membrane factor (OMF) lipoprotein